MSGGYSAFDITRAAQWRASNPAVSAWVSANAGSGKTYVLSQRVLRLLLQGVPPAKIICLTYTKAAAANMAMRVFSTLAEWTRLNDQTLRARIADLGLEEAQTPEDLARARRLFARTVETPGGLKIQTIHAFCERLLHLFPFEAGVAASFTVMEDDEVQRALKYACDQCLASAKDNQDLSHHLDIFARASSADAFFALMKEALTNRHHIQDMLRHGGIARYVQQLMQWLDVPATLTAQQCAAQKWQWVIPPTEWMSVSATLMQGSSADQTNAHFFRTAASFDDADLAYNKIRPFYITSKGPRTRLMTKGLASSYPSLHQAMEHEQKRIIDYENNASAFALVERSHALMVVFEYVAHNYRRYKALRGKLDFDDLITRTVDLLSRSTAAQWVLYKLDSGIDHILVDEAQDTSPPQWQILNALTHEFTSGAGHRTITRSFFAVGDEKQSIYSFQGAEPEQFSMMRRHFEQRVTSAGLDFATIPLYMSFRSATGILKSVDTIFRSPAHRAGLSSDDVELVHEAWKTHLPSRVELWPHIERSDEDHDNNNWLLPVDALEKNDPIVIVAHRLARAIADLIAPSSSERVADKQGDARPIRAGDIMILVRKRGPLFNAIIRALKEHNVPVAGADRLELTDHLAVMDLIALGRALLLPDDDLTLACVLKSPFFDFSDDDLLMLAPQRGDSSLWTALANSPAYRGTYELLCQWQNYAQHHTPFEFYTFVLSVMQGRQKLTARLGVEAGDALDEFLRHALNFERNEPAALLGFLSSLDGADIAVKRDLEAASHYVRVMTAHAAKGLEAKIVFLPDTTSPPVPRGRVSKNLLSVDLPSGSLLFWSKNKTDPPQTQSVRAAEEMAIAQEHRRLLYVALTRAEERLYIMGVGKVNEQSWYDIIHTGLASSMHSAPAPWDAHDKILILSHGAFKQEAPHDLSPLRDDKPLPVWALKAAAPEYQPELPMSPSTALAAADQFEKVSASDHSASSALYGRLMHVLLQYLPTCAPQKRAQAAQNFITSRAQMLAPALQHMLCAEALAVFDDPIMRDLLRHPKKQAEVALAGRVTLPHGVSIDVAGQIDLLIDAPEALYILDYKTGPARDLADTPEAYLAQLGLYRRLVMRLYPARDVRALLIWTSGPRLCLLAEEQMEKALRKIRSSAH
jgi:ATP-dependent helicase/nuclease subunit A